MRKDTEAMRIIRLTTLSLLLAAFALAGCSESTKDQNALLMQENEDLRVQLADRNAALETAHQDNRDKARHISELRRQVDEIEIASSTAMANTPITGFEGIPGVTGVIGVGEITARVDSDVLFDSGKTSLRPAAKRSLDAVAQVLTSMYRGRQVRIDGHTDKDPIRKSGYKSNYHLGFERAFAVRDYLISRGVPKDMIYLASYGPDEPMTTKSQSRRVEIVVLASG